MATIDSDTVTVTWMFDNSGNNVPLTQFTYAVRQNGVIVDEGTIGPGVQSVTISLADLTAGTLYDVSVTAHNLLGMSQVVGNQFTTPMGGSAGELFIMRYWSTCLCIVHIINCTRYQILFTFCLSLIILYECCKDVSEHYRDCNGNSSAHVQDRRQLDLVLLSSGLCNTTPTYHDNILLVGSVSGYVLLFLFSFGYSILYVLPVRLYNPGYVLFIQFGLYLHLAYMCFQYGCIILY